MSEAPARFLFGWAALRRGFGAARIRKMATSAWLAAWALHAVLLVGTTARAAESRAFYVNYSARVPTAPLLAHPLSIVHPAAELDLAAAQAAGNTVLAYVSVGEIAADAPYRGEVLRRRLPFAGRNEAWNSDVVDLTDPRWSDFLVQEVATPAARRGFDGFFLDTLDAVELVDQPNTPRRAAARAGLIATIKRLRAAFPQKRIVINRGFFAFDELRDVVDGVLVESLFETHDFTTKSYRAVPAAETQSLLAALQPVTAAARAVYVLDYADPKSPARAQGAAARIRALGFHAFVSTPGLDGETLAPLRPVPRRICAFYGNLSQVQEDQVRWPAESFVGQKLALPLEWLGFEVDYFHVAQASDLPRLTDDYRAIVLPRFWQIPSAVEAAAVDWLIAARNQGKKVLIFGGLPFRDPEQRKRFVAAFGMHGTGAVVAPPLVVETVVQQSELLGFEASVPALPTNHLDLRAPADARRILSVKGQPEEGVAVRFDPVFVCSWGGVALEPYLLFRRPDFRDFWLVDPFAFLRLALGEIGAPVPDTTTRDGLRLFMSHIDGDGFANMSRVEPGRRSAEIIRDRILRKYPLPVTVSVIEAELRGLVRAQRAEDSPALEAIARDIFALPQIEAASHTFSHPFFWIEGDRTESFYDEQRLDLKVPYPQIDLAREIEGSVRYINERLVPPQRPVRVFLWSGNCRPPPDAIARVRELGLENVNGGDTLISPRDPTITAVAPRTMRWGNEVQVYAPNQNENVYTNNWRGPLFGTFIHVLDTFRLTESPRRLKPVNVYYHFYSGDHPASLHALETVLDSVAAQPLHAIPLSQYARIARDARDVAIYGDAQDRWTIVTRGDLRTFRLPAEVARRLDLTRSAGVTGWRIERDQAYVHTDGRRVVTVAVGPAPVPFPRLESSSGEIVFQERSVRLLRCTVSDLRPVQLVFAGFSPRAPITATINGVGQPVEATAEGAVSLTVPSHSELSLEVASR